MINRSLLTNYDPQLSLIISKKIAYLNENILYLQQTDKPSTIPQWNSINEYDKFAMKTDIETISSLLINTVFRFEEVKSKYEEEIIKYSRLLIQYTI